MRAKRPPTEAASELLLGRQLDRNMGHVADHFNAPIGSVALERFQNQEELLRKHGITSLVMASPFVEVDCWKFNHLREIGTISFA